MIYHEIRTIVFLDDFRLFIFYLLCKIYNTNSITDIRLSGALFIAPSPSSHRLDLYNRIRNPTLDDDVINTDKKKINIHREEKQ